VPGYNVTLGRGDWRASLVSGGLVKTGVFGTEADFQGQWSQLVVVVDRSRGELRLYANGQLASTVDIGILGPIANELDAGLGQPPGVFNGALDELRVLGAVAPVEWIAAEYANLTAPDAFLTVLAEDPL
jgi:hypothetical protein